MRPWKVLIREAFRGRRSILYSFPCSLASRIITLPYGINFYTAIYVFNDENRLEDDNSIVDGELRQQTIGEPRPPVLEGHPINTKRSRPKAVIGKVEGVLFVVFVENEDELGTSTRIISARAADEEEVAAYFEELMY